MSGEGPATCAGAAAAVHTVRAPGCDFTARATTAVSSFTAISIRSATRIPQETCWIPQETCLLAKKALVGFRNRNFLAGRKASVACSLVPTLRALSRVLALRALSFRGTLHPPRLPPELFCVCMCAGTRRARRLRAARPDRYELSSAYVSCMSLLIHIRALRSRENSQHTQFFFTKVTDTPQQSRTGHTR